MEYCMRSALDRDTLIEQSPNYSNRTFSGIIQVGPAIIQLTHISIRNQKHEPIKIPSFTDESNFAVS